MNRTMNLSIRTIAVLAMVALLAQSAAAAQIQISYLGYDSTTQANWRTTSVAKPAAFDPSGDNAYGTDGYFVLHGNDGSAYNDGSIIEGHPASIQSLPSYISNVTFGSLDLQVSTPIPVNMSPLDDPRQPIGPSVAQLDRTEWAFLTTGANYAYIPCATVTLAQSGSFTLNVITGADRASYYNGTYAVKVTSGDVSADSLTTPLTANDGNIDHTFFRLSGNAGDTFTISNMAVTGVIAYSGIGFEGFVAVPEPSTIVLLISGLVGLVAYAWRKRK
jgi:hypothetical protein